MARGESLVASSGVALALVLFGVLAAAGWWTMRVHAAALDRAARARVDGMVQMIADSAAVALESESTGPVQSLVGEIAAKNGLVVCKVILPGNRIIADLDVGSINLRTIPMKWPAGEVAPPPPQPELASAFATAEVHKRGKVGVLIGMRLADRTLAQSDMALGLGVIAAGGLILWLVAYRHVRVRLRGIGAIGDALRAAAEGENSTAVLGVGAGFGPEAEAWNRILAERDTFRAKVMTDRLSEKLANGASSAGEGELGAAFDALWQGMIVLDEHARVRYVNGAGASLLGAKRDEIVGSEFAQFVKDKKVVDAVTAACFGATRQRVSIEIDRPGEATRGVIRYSVRAMRQEDAAAAVCIVEDVTQQRVADEAKNSFVTQVTHELRTPLTNIRLYLETLTDEGENDPATRARCINVIGQEARRLERIVSDMLSVSEIEAGSLKLYTEDVRLDQLFEDVKNDFQVQAKDKEIALVFELPPKLPVIKGDRDKIVLALHNLIGNALKYTPAGGQVRVAVEEEGGGVNISVIDNGIGIKPEETEMIFEKFYRAKDKRLTGITGSGLGLTLARQVVRLHGGDIHVRSQLDKGSTFTMSLPLGKAA